MLSLEFRKLVVGPMTGVFELLIELGLHLSLLEEHLLTDLVNLLLVFDHHLVAHAAHFLSRLGEVT